MTETPNPAQRAGFAAIIGAPNAGKSTLVNRLTGSKVSIVTQKVQTTRFPVRGIAMEGAAQIILVDTPGIFTPRRRLDRAMVASAWGGAEDADIVVHLIDAQSHIAAEGRDGTAADRRSAEDTETIIANLQATGTKVLLALNKIDGMRRDTLLALSQKLFESGVYEEVYMISAANGDGVDDLLNEARFQLEFLLRMQVPEGARAAVLLDEVPRMVDAGGLVHHKVHDRAWTALPMAPADDPQPRFLYPPSTAATLNLAAVGAQCARVWRDIDAAFADRCLAAARTAYAAAKANPGLFADGRFDGGGPYGDRALADEFYWAAAELWATTGEAAYEADARASTYWLGGPRSGASATGDPAFAQTAALGTVTLASAPRLSEAERRTARDNLVAAARQYLAEAKTQGYAFPRGGDRFEWGSNSVLMNRAMILGLAHDFTGEAAFRQGVIASLDYLLGRNPLDQSFISGWGERAMRHPHHRFWAAGAGPDWPEPPAGALSGGPNNTNMADEVAKAMQGRCAPLACWADHIDSYALNEVAINWNAPLVWVAAFIDPQAQ